MLKNSAAIFFFYLLALLSLLALSFWATLQTGYRAGQLDAYHGKFNYSHVVGPDGSELWIRLRQPTTHPVEVHP